MLHSDDQGGGQRYESVAWFDSECMPGVRYGVARFSVARRIELTRRIRDAGRNLEFLAASADGRDKLDAAVVSAELDRIYIEWGLLAIEGLHIDGKIATATLLLERGPIALAKEVLEQIRSASELSEIERKN
jgi:hypothetical protein